MPATRSGSVPLAAFAPLADCPGVRLFSLQKHHGSEQLAPLADRLKIVDLGPLVDEAGGRFRRYGGRHESPGSGDHVRYGRGTSGRRAGRAGLGGPAGGARLALAAGPRRQPLVSDDAACFGKRAPATGATCSPAWPASCERRSRRTEQTKPAKAFAIVDALDAAEQLRLDGRLEQAEQQCREILAIDPVLVESPPRAADRRRP